VRPARDIGLGLGGAAVGGQSLATPRQDPVQIGSSWVQVWSSSQRWSAHPLSEECTERFVRPEREKAEASQANNMDCLHSGIGHRSQTPIQLTKRAERSRNRNLQEGEQQVASGWKPGPIEGSCPTRSPATPLEAAMNKYRHGQQMRRPAGGLGLAAILPPDQ